VKTSIIGVVVVHGDVSCSLSKDLYNKQGR